MKNSIDQHLLKLEDATMEVAPKKAASMVSEPSILGRGRRLEAQFEETMNGFERMVTSLRELHREQEVGRRRTNAKFDALNKLLLDLSFPGKGRSTTTTKENSSSRESPKTEENFSRPLPQVDGPISENLDSHDGGWDVQQTAAMVEVDSESAVCPIVAIFYDNKLEVNDVEVISDAESMGYPLVKTFAWELDRTVIQPLRKGMKCEIVSFSDYMTFSNSKYFKETKFLPTARRNTPLKEHVITLSVMRDLNNLLDWDPKPKVRMKLMKFASRDGYEEEFTNLVMADKKGSKEVSIGSTVPNEQSLRNHKKVKLNVVASDPYILSSSHYPTAYPKVGNSVGVSEKIEVVDFSEHDDCLKLMKPMKDVILSLARGSTPEVSASSIIFISLKKLSVQFSKPMVKMKCRAVLTASWISDIDLSRCIVIESLRQLNGDEDDFDFVDFFSRFSLNYVSLGLLWRGTSMLAASSLAVTSVFGKDYISNRIDIGSPRIGIDHIDGLVEQHCSVVEDEQYGSASSLDLTKKRFEVADVIKTKFLNKKRWLQRLKEDKGEKGWMSIVYLFDGYEVVMRHDPFEVFVRGSGENGKEVLSSNGLFEFEQLREKEEMEDWGGRFSIHERPYGSLGKSQGNLEFFSLNGAKMQVNVLETARNEEFSSMMLMLLADQKRDDTLWMSEGSVMKTCQPSDIVWWVSIWFPKPTVKMKHERLGFGIPCGQGILWGVDCYDHNLRRERNAMSAGVPRQLKQK